MNDIKEAMCFDDQMKEVWPRVRRLLREPMFRELIEQDDFYE